MLAFALTVLAFGAGCTLTYFVMDSPRKRAKKQLAQLDDDRARLDEQREQVRDVAARGDARKRTLDAAAADHDRRAKELAVGIAAFEKRVVSYDELAGENRILKADLKNVAVQMDHLQCLHDGSQKELVAVKEQRNQLGRDYFDEVRGAARKAITPATYPANKQKVRTAAEHVRAAGVELPPADEEKALAELHSQYERAVRATVEREEQARLRERIREEQRQEREAQEAIEQAERERRTVAAALERALADAAGRHAAEVDQLRAQLAEAEAKAQRAVSQAMLTKSGNVYVISNRGSFGPDVLKIGMTRRLEPLDRVYELGDASVPFPFDVHMMIKCEDAPKLENALHRAFHKRRVNKVNLRKEFFRVTVAEVAEVVRQQHGEVEYQADAEALEYLQSITMTDADLEEVEEVYAQAEAAVGAGPSGDQED